MRNKQVAKNLIIISIYQVLAVLLGFYVPKIFLEYIGSETYGLINSITNFMGYISVLQVGVGGVVNAALYKPLAEKDNIQLSVVVTTARNFFRKIAYASIGYIVVLAFVFALYLAKDFDANLTIALVIGIGAGTFIQYYFGIINQMILTADQKAYVDSITQIICLILNAIIVVNLVKFKFPVAAVKIMSVLVYAIRPILLNIYVHNYYQIDYKAKYDNSLMKQRWYAMAQAVAYYVHSKADVFLLTVFRSFGDIAVYGVYALITTSLTKIIQIVDTSVQATFGNVFAKKETSLLDKRFGQYTTIMHVITPIVFTTALVSSIPFVLVYTKKVNDYNYNVPLFSFFILLSEMTYCLRMPYAMMISVSGRYKETMIGAYIEAVLNIIISIVGYQYLGLTGIAIGTFVAMLYRTVDYLVFLHGDILKIKYSDVVRRYGTTVICIIASYVSTFWIYKKIKIQDFGSWFVYTFLSFVLIGAIHFIMNYLVYKDDISYAISACLGLLRSKRTKV